MRFPRGHGACPIPAFATRRRGHFSPTFPPSSTRLLQLLRLLRRGGERIERSHASKQRVLDLLLGKAIPFAVPRRIDVLARSRCAILLLEHVAVVTRLVLRLDDF